MTKPCPRCNAAMTLDSAQGVYRCPNGHRVFETLEEAQARLRAKGERPTVTIAYRGALDPRARSLFETAHDHLWQGNTAAADDALRDALDVQADFTDAHLWLARLADDPRAKRGHLESVLALDPGQTDAIRELMVLDGKLTPEAAERSRQGGEPILMRAEQVKAVVQTLECPVCGGDLTLDASNRRVVCKFCGYSAPMPTPADDGAQTVGAALIEQRARGVRWQIGARLLRCKNCGAERTIAQGRMSEACPFCGTTAVIVADATGALEQPDALIPFRLDEEAAKAAVRERLKAADERLYALLGDNKTASAAIEGVYLPFWAFDAVTHVTRRVTSDARDRFMRGSQAPMLDQTSDFQDGVLGVLVPAFANPPERQVEAAGALPLHDLVPYDARLLAKFPAALYTVPFDRASLAARSKAAAVSRARFDQSDAPNTQVSVSAFVQQMTFRLVLAPFWLATLTERDGDRRLALVNGVSGRVAIGGAGRVERARRVAGLVRVRYHVGIGHMAREREAVMERYTLQEAQTHLDKLIEAAQHGETVLILDDQDRAVQLVPVRGAGPRKAGSARGQIRMAADFDAPLSDFDA